VHGRDSGRGARPCAPSVFAPKKPWVAANEAGMLLIAKGMQKPTPAERRRLQPKAIPESCSSQEVPGLESRMFPNGCGSPAISSQISSGTFMKIDHTELREIRMTPLACAGRVLATGGPHADGRGRLIGYGPLFLMITIKKLNRGAHLTAAGTASIVYLPTGR
jgi:hypothetical protein